MSPDPKTVREIARDALVIAIRRGATEAVEAALIAHGGTGPVVGEKFDVYTNAVAAEYDRMAAALVRPDEQQPADVVTAEQQQDEAAEDVTAFLDIWEAEHGSGSIRGGNVDVPYLFSSDLCAVLAERAALAARVAKLESEREADARAALALLKLGEVLYLGQRPTDWADARRQLAARFADRIEALAATGTEES